MKILKNITYFFLSAVIAFSFASCEDDESVGAPSISYFRAMDTSDVITYANLGQTIAIIGENLETTSSVTFNGYPADFRTTLRTNTSVIVEVSKSTPFQGDSATGVVELVTDGGTVTGELEIAPPAPELTSISPLLAFEGGELTIHGSYFYNITEVKFGDVAANVVAYTPSEIVVTVPEGVAEGATISVTSAKSGVGTSELSLDATPVLLNWGDTWPTQGGWWNNSADGPDAGFANLGTGSAYKYIDQTYGDTWWIHDGGINFDSTAVKAGDPSQQLFRFEYNLIGTVYRLTLRFVGSDGNNYEYHQMDLPATGGKWATYTIKVGDFKVDGSGSALTKAVWENGDPKLFQWAFVNQTGGEISTKCAFTNFRFLDL